MFERIDLLATSVGVAILGGVANFLTSDEHTVFQLVVSVFLAGFVGLLVGVLVIEHYKLDEAWVFFICGSSGVAAEAILKIMKKLAIERVYTLIGLKPVVKVEAKEEKSNE